jgi:phage shock protein C
MALLISDTRWPDACSTAFEKPSDEEDRSMYKNTTRQLRRQNGIIGGVCGGLGAFFGISPFWFRLLFIILALPGGAPGILPYVILWIVIPKSEG